MFSKRISRSTASRKKASASVFCPVSSFSFAACLPLARGVRKAGARGVGSRSRPGRRYALLGHGGGGGVQLLRQRAAARAGGGAFLLQLVQLRLARLRLCGKRLRPLPAGRDGLPVRFGLSGLGLTSKAALAELFAERRNGGVVMLDIVVQHR